MRDVLPRDRSMAEGNSHALPASVGDTLNLLGSADYVADRSLATAVHLSLHLKRPLFLEGEAGVGKTEIAKVLATSLGRRLIRLQCYEGLDVSSAVYEWDYARQMIEIRLAEAGRGGPQRDREHDLLRPVPDQAAACCRRWSRRSTGPPVLLIDELDRTDEPFEAFLLELLSDFQVTIPEIGTIRADHPPIVVITSNRTREIHDALKRRCFYYWVDYPNAERELEILKRKAPRASADIVAPGRRVRAEIAQDGFVQIARHRRDDRLGRGADAARRAGTDPRGDPRHARRPAQVPGRHRPHPGQRGGKAAWSRSRPRSPPPPAKCELAVPLSPHPHRLRGGPLPPPQAGEGCLRRCDQAPRLLAGRIGVGAEGVGCGRGVGRAADRQSDAFRPHACGRRGCRWGPAR